MIIIPHIKQKKDGFNWRCGAACLEMIFAFYGIEKTQDEIWAKTSSPRNTGPGQRYIRTYDLARYACDSGLSATIYKAKEESWSSLLDELSKKGIPAILSLMQPKSKQSHFIVFKGKKHSDYCFCDPDENRDTVRYDYRMMRDIWSPRPEINVTGYILVVFGEKEQESNCPHCHDTVPIVHSWIGEYAQAICCPNCDRLFSNN